MRKRSWVRVLLLFSWWTFLGLFFASRLILTYSYRGEPLNWKLPVQMSMTEWYGWAVLSPAILWLARCFSFSAPHWKRDLVVHFGASLAVAAVKLEMDGLLLRLVTGIPIRVNAAFNTHSNLLTYWVIVAVILVYDYNRKYRERELRASQLEARLAEARLQVLRMQLQPHFLFNTLNAVSALMHRDVEAAEKMLARLSELLRSTLELGGAQEVTLKEELDLLQRYLEIEQVRFGKRLSVEFSIDSGSLDARVPNLILQPLVENSIRHGIAPRAAPGQIAIGAKRRGQMLQLEVRDNGPGLPRGPSFREGIGLGNTRSRLQQLYGGNHSLKLEDLPQGGLAVTIEIPFQVQSGTATNGER